MTPEQLRWMEAVIADGPTIPVVPDADEKRLRAADPALDALLPGCMGVTPGGVPCSQERPCWDCQLRRRYLALLLHRERFGRVPHPSDNFPLPLGSDAVRDLLLLLVEVRNRFPAEWAALVRPVVESRRGPRICQENGANGNGQRRHGNSRAG